MSYVGSSMWVQQCLSLGFITVNIKHDQGNSYKGKQLIGAGLQFTGLIYYHQDRSMAEFRELWYWRKSWEFYIQTDRPQEENETHQAWLVLMRPQSPPSMTHFHGQCHTYSNKVTPAYSANLCKLMEPFSF